MRSTIRRRGITFEIGPRGPSGWHEVPESQAWVIPQPPTGQDETQAQFMISTRRQPVPAPVSQEGLEPGFAKAEPGRFP